MMSGFETISMILTSCQIHSVQLSSSVLQLKAGVGGGGGGCLALDFWRSHTILVARLPPHSLTGVARPTPKTRALRGCGDIPHMPIAVPHCGVAPS